MPSAAVHDTTDIMSGKVCEILTILESCDHNPHCCKLNLLLIIFHHV